MAPQASKKCGLLPPDHPHIGCCASNSLNSKQIAGAFSALTISSRSPQESAQSEKRFLTPFSSTKWPQRRHREGTSSSHQTWRERYEKVEGSLRGRDVDAGRLVVLFQPASAIGDPVSK